MVSSQTLLAGRLSQEPGSQHFWYQKYFAGRMVSSQTLLADQAIPGVRIISTSGARNILLVEWFLVRLCSRSGYPRTPDHWHFWRQKCFAARLVSHSVENRIVAESTVS